MVGRIGLVALISIVAATLVAGGALAELRCTWCDEDFDGGGGGGETYNATLVPDDGKYLNRTDDNVYYYDASTGSLTYLEDNDQDTEDEPNQAGECNYVLGDWTDSDAEYTYGRCISLRVKDNESREIQARMNVREVDGGPYQMVVDLHFLDADGNSTGEPERLYRVNCFSNASAGSHEITQCEDMRSPQLNVSDWPSDAAKWCVRAGLLEYEDGDYLKRLDVEPPCHEV
jgi:hypothetical protein